MNENVFDVGGFKVRIQQDSDAESPRDWHNLGTMLCWHNRYRLGDKNPFATNQDFQESDERRDAAVILPLYLYDHSGLTINTTGFYCPWDSGQVGWVYVTKEHARKEYGKCLTKKRLEFARKCLIAEVETYDQFLRGDVYGFVIEDNAGNHVDSCWGFFGFDYCKSEALSAANYALEKEIETLDAH